jgi:hypothetical protein
MKVDPEIQANTLANLASRCDAPDQFERFDLAFRASLGVAKVTVEKEEIRQKRQRAKARKKRVSK